MKRSSFISAGISCIAGITLPIATFAKRLRNPRNETGFFVPAGKDRHETPISLYDGDIFYTKVSTEDSNGAMYLVETFRDKKGGPPLHYHPEQDEWWYVLEGEFEFKVGDRFYNAKPGDSIFGPRMVPHAFNKINEGSARVMILFQPAGKMEENFNAVAAGVTKGMTVEQRNNFSKEHGIVVVGPALGNMKR